MRDATSPCGRCVNSASCGLTAAGLLMNIQERRLVVSVCWAKGAQSTADVHVQNQPFSLEALGLFLVARASSHFPRFSRVEDVFQCSAELEDT